MVSDKIQQITRDITSGSSMQRLFEISLDMLCVANFEGFFISLNSVWEKTFGYKADELKSSPYIEFVHPEDQAETIAEINKVASGLDAIAFENRFRCKDGSYRWLSWNIVANLNEALLYAIAHDITHQKETENKSRLQSTALDAAVNSIVITDSKGNIEWVNPAFSTLTGYSYQEVIGLNPRFLKSGFQDQQMYTELWNTILAGQVWVGELINRRKNGSLYTEEMTITPMQDEHGKISHFIAIKRDVTARKMAEQAHRASELRYRTLFEDAVVSLWEEDFSHVKQHLEELQGAGVNDFRAYFNNHPEEVTHCSSLIKILDVNQATLKLLEANNKEELFAGLDVVFSEQTYEVFKEQLIAFAEGARHSENDAVHRTLTGKTLYVRVSVLLMDVESWSRVSVSVTDFTQRKHAEDNLLTINRIVKLATSTLRVEKVLEAICTEVSLLLNIPDSSGLLVDKDTGYAELVWRSKQVIAKTLYSLESNPIFDHIMHLKEPIVISDAPNSPLVQGAYEAIVQDDVQTLICIPLFAANGDISGLVCLSSTEYLTFSDKELSLVGKIGNAASQALENSLLHAKLSDYNANLTHLVASRTEQLERINDRMAAILNYTSDAIVLLDANNNIRNTNRSFDQMFEYDTDELFDRPLGILVDESARDQLIETLGTIRATNESQRLNLTMLSKNGQVFETDTAIAFVKDNGGHMVCSIRDITHLKEIERLKDRFVSMVSHELRTPISTIMLSLSTMSTYFERMSDDQKKQQLQQSYTQAERLGELVASILDIARLDAGKSQTQLDSVCNVDVAQILREVVIDLTGLAEAKNHRINVQTFNRAMTIVGESGNIARVWSNLLSNAIKYTDNGGQINIRLYGADPQDESPYQLPDLTEFNGHIPLDIACGQYIIGIVEDNGYGIRSQDLPQLFTRFFRGWSTNTTIPGTGLGLSLVRETLQIYGGDIAVSSEVGVGTSFCLWLPVADTPK